MFVSVYNRFTIGLDTKEMDGVDGEGMQLNATMFVSVYNRIQVKHPAVAIAININNPYTLEWSGGPNPWPRKEIFPVDAQFVHDLEVSIPHSVSLNDSVKRNGTAKDFGYRYNRNTLEFMCYRPFHGTVTLTVSNLESESLPHPMVSVAEVEVFCFPQFRYGSKQVEMGVGTRRNAKELYPEWVSSAAAAEFEIELEQKESEIVSVMDNEKVQAKRLGKAVISGKLVHPTQRVHIHPPGFHNALSIVVLFKGFIIEVPAVWIIEGNDQIVHIEGLDGIHHILPNRQNFDDVFVEWTSDDAKRNAVGSGLSVKLVAHSVGQVNIKAAITLRTQLKKIKTQWTYSRTVTVIPRVVSPCNSIILKPNSSMALSGQFQPDTAVDSIGQIYAVKHDYAGVHGAVVVEDNKLKVAANARSGENVVVTLVLQSPSHDDRYAHRAKQYPLNQASSLTVSIVEPTGLNLVSSPYGSMVMDNAVWTESVREFMAGNGEPFWTTLSSAQKVRSVEFSKTENVMCEHQRVTVKIAILDELGRELHAMEQCKAVSNDTSIVDALKEIKIGTDRVGGAMYAAVELNALQPGYATITFQGEKDQDGVLQSAQRERRDFYVNDNPNFLRPFLTIRVLSSRECEAQFGVHFVAESGSVKNESGRSQQGLGTHSKGTRSPQNIRQSPSVSTVAMDAHGGDGSWWMRNKNAIGMVLVTALLAIVCCGWNVCGANGPVTIPMAVANDGRHHAAQFDPIQHRLNSSRMNPYSASTSFQM